jgi:hypothetical protein
LADEFSGPADRSAPARLGAGRPRSYNARPVVISGLEVAAVARRAGKSKRTRNEKILIVLGILVAISMVASSFAFLLFQ